MKRLEQLNELIKEEPSKIIRRDFDMPEGSLLTITHVDTTDNKISARVFITVLEATAGDEERTLEELSRKTYGIQKSLNRALRIRPVPKIMFAIDKEEKRRERIEALLADISVENKPSKK